MLVPRKNHNSTASPEHFLNSLPIAIGSATVANPGRWHSTLRTSHTLNYSSVKLIFATLCCLTLTVTNYAQKFDTTYYSVVDNGFITGAQKTWKESKNEFNYIYYYHDRGRGPNVSEKIITNVDGKITSSITTGVNYAKNPYSASFSIIKDSAAWTVNEVRKTKKYNNEIYLGNYSPAVQELTTNWVLKQPHRKAVTLNGDSLKLSKPVIKKITYNNKTLTLKICTTYYGDDPTPSYTWMTVNMKLFADIGSGIILKGYEKWIDTLTSIEQLEAAGFFKAQFKQYSEILRKHLLITHATLFQSSDASVQSNMSVEVGNGKIISIFSSDRKIPIHADSTIDAKGKFLMPGLWDMHSHYGNSDGIWYLAGGVTHIRDMGNKPIIQTWQQQIRKNQLLGPDISYISGLIDKEDSLQAPIGKIVPSLAKALEAIDYYHKKGYNQIKIYNSIKPEWVKPMANHAHALGMRVAGHVPAYMTAAQAINAGYDEITHDNMIFLNFMGADTLATNGIIRMRLPALLSGTIDLESEQVRSFIQLMKSKSIVHDPTLRVQESLYTEFIGDTNKMIIPIISWLPESNKKGLANTSSFGTPEQKPAYLASFKNTLKMVKLLYDNGILLVAGTDGGDAVALHRELEIYSEAGIPDNEVLKIATYNAAKDCGLQNVYGQIKVGRDADFILIDGDPAKNISDIRRVEWVIKGGRMYSPKKLLASQGWKYYY